MEYYYLKNIKVCVENKDYIHIKVFKPLPNTGQPVSLTAVQAKKTLQDDITHF